MESEELISADELCTHYHIEYSLIQTFHESGLIDVTLVQETRYLPGSQLPKLERLVRLHHELDINVAGLEAIVHLLERMEHKQQEIQRLQNRLRFYEGGQ
jgi:chaperone modulatory protein CbpM